MPDPNPHVAQDALAGPARRPVAAPPANPVERTASGSSRPVPGTAFPATTAPDAPAAAAVTFAGVTKRYGTQLALDDLTLAFERGRVTALLGPNGAGKTTAIGLLLGLLRPTRGAVRLLGRDPQRPASRRAVGTMLQDVGAPDTLRVRELVDLWRSFYPQPLRTAEVIERAGLGPLAGRFFGGLSGGQRRRVAFGLALAGDPEVLVLDEPSAGLDLEARRALWAALRDYADAGNTLIFSTHHLEEADALADRIVLLNRGRVVADGAPDAIKAQVGGRLVRCSSTLPLAALRALAGVTGASREGRTVALRTQAAEATLRDLLERDAHVAGVEVTSVGLEQAFLTLTRDGGRP